MRLDFIDSILLTEADASPRIPHPEDAIFSGLPEAQKALTALQKLVKTPQAVTIKWDGAIALIFGYTPGGEFFINDKYMPEGFYAKSPQDWQRYDTEIKSSRQARPDLYPKIAAIWEGLRASVTAQAVFKGDLMAIGDQMRPQGNQFVFKSVTVTYSVPLDSPMGQVMKNKVAMIVVHSMNGTPWDGVTGLKNVSNVAVVGPTGLPAGQKSAPFKLAEPTQAINTAKTVLAKFGPTADKFLSSLDGVSRGKIQTYFNKKITSQTNDPIEVWLTKPESNTKPATVKKLLGDNMGGYLYRDAKGYQALVAVWNAMYQLKTHLAGQLEKQITGFSQSINGQPQGEGFVANVPGTGLVKLVNRGVFGGAHFNQ